MTTSRIIPTAIELTIAGLRSKVGDARILAVLEPRSNTMKLGVMKDSLAPSLRARISCSATPTASAGTPTARSRRSGASRHFDDLAQLVAAIVAAARAGDHVLVMSNGGFGGVHGQLLQALSARA